MDQMSIYHVDACSTNWLIRGYNVQYGLKIFVLTSFKDTCYIEILPKIQKSNRGRVLFFYFLLGVNLKI